MDQYRRKEIRRPSASLPNLERMCDIIGSAGRSAERCPGVWTWAMTEAGWPPVD